MQFNEIAVNSVRICCIKLQIVQFVTCASPADATVWGLTGASKLLTPETPDKEPPRRVRGSDLRTSQVRKRFVSCADLF